MTKFNCKWSFPRTLLRYCVEKYFSAQASHTSCEPLFFLKIKCLDDFQENQSIDVKVPKRYPPGYPLYCLRDPFPLEGPMDASNINQQNEFNEFLFLESMIS